MEGLCLSSLPRLHLVPAQIIASFCLSGPYHVCALLHTCGAATLTSSMCDCRLVPRSYGSWQA